MTAGRPAGRSAQEWLDINAPYSVAADDDRGAVERVRDLLLYGRLDRDATVALFRRLSDELAHSETVQLVRSAIQTARNPLHPELLSYIRERTAGRDRHVLLQVFVASSGPLLTLRIVALRLLADSFRPTLLSRFLAQLNDVGRLDPELAEETVTLFTQGRPELARHLPREILRRQLGASPSETLSALSNPSLKPLAAVLCEVADSVPDEERPLLANTLGVLGSSSAESVLLELLQSEDLETARSAAQALGRVGTIDVVVALIEQSRGLLRDGQLKRAARTAISEIQARSGGVPGALALTEPSHETGQLTIHEAEAGMTIVDLSLAAAEAGPNERD